MNLNHPTPEQLCGLATGRLDEGDAVDVSLHLATCEACRTAVESVPDDAFMTLLKQAAACVGPRLTGGGLIGEESLSRFDLSKPLLDR